MSHDELLRQRKDNSVADHCPFWTYTEEYRATWYNFRLERKYCGPRKLCMFTKKEVPCIGMNQLVDYISNCVILKHVSDAFKEKNWGLIHYFWLKSNDERTWNRLVDYIFDINDLKCKYDWKIKVGRWLQGECRELPSCPYKALLPEGDV